MKIHEFIFLLLAIIVGVFVALAVFALIVKNQIQAQLAASPTATNALSLLTQL